MIWCLWFPKSETFLDSTVLQDGEYILINNYSLWSAGHTINGENERVCFNIKEHLPLIRRNYLSILQECLVTNIIVENENVCMYVATQIKVTRN